MRTRRFFTVEFKRRVAQEYLSGEAVGSLSRRYDLPRNLIRIWVGKYEAGVFEEDARPTGAIREYEARIAALERLVGRQAMELEFLKGALRSTARPRGGSGSVITGPAVSPLLKDVG
jgi:transposase-like protein